MLIRRETDRDAIAIHAVTAEAFVMPSQPGVIPAEARLVDELRAGPAWLPGLSLVAVEATEWGSLIVGHVVASRGHVGTAPALGLGPLSVHPDHQRHGVGSALMHAVLGAADALNEPMVVLLGDPGYYRRFGFVPSTEHGVLPPVAEWRPHFQVRPLTAHDPAVRGTFTYAEAFDRV